MSAEDYNALRAQSRSKYGNVKTEVDGIRFDSIAEARHYQELRLRELAGELVWLEVHPHFDLIVNGIKIAVYVADFAYHDTRTHRYVVEDVKGGKATRTPVYRLKKKLLSAAQGVEIVEIEA